MDASCPLRGEENGMRGFVHILNFIFVKCELSLRRQWWVRALSAYRGLA